MYSTKVLKKLNRRNIKWKKLAFYTILMAIPVIQISLFYVYVNFSSFLMAFRNYSLTDEGMIYTYSWENFVNFQNGWAELVSDQTRLANTFIYFAFGLIINIPLALLSSFYIYRKKHASGFFKVMLFMPQVLSSLVLAFIYKEILERGIPYWMGTLGQPGLLTNPNSAVWFVILFNLIMSFGVNVLIYSSTMSGINESILESSEIDGCGSFRQFVYVILPMIYPTIVSLIIVFISAFFTNQYNVFTLFSSGDGTPATTCVGHYLYVQNLKATYYSIGQKSTLTYPELAAVGLILTFIILPISLFSRWALNKFGPRVD